MFIIKAPPTTGGAFLYDENVFIRQDSRREFREVVREL